MLKIGDQVEILSEFQYPGDESFTRVVIGNEEKDRVDISPLNINMEIKPVYTVQTQWTKLAAVHGGE